MKEYTKEETDKMQKAPLGGANIQPFDWLLDYVFDEYEEVNVEEAQNDFLCFIHDDDNSKELIARVQFKDYPVESDNNFICIRILNKDVYNALEKLENRILEGNDEPECCTITRIDKLHSGTWKVYFYWRPDEDKSSTMKGV